MASVRGLQNDGHHGQDSGRPCMHRGMPASKSVIDWSNHDEEAGLRTTEG